MAGWWLHFYYTSGTIRSVQTYFMLRMNQIRKNGGVEMFSVLNALQKLFINTMYVVSCMSSKELECVMY